ncbi:MAG: hypothetical protein QNJ44_13805 [Rhodobacter sp.]|nr:hypothetical protein [Rhodobacter sp.]
MARLTSEDVKNWVTSISIIVGGFWVLFQWNVLFPKTAADIEITAADLRTRTSGVLHVALYPALGGVSPSTADGREFYELCAEAGTDSVTLRFPIRMALNLESNAPIPIRVVGQDFLVSEIKEMSATLSDEEGLPAFTPDAFGPVRMTKLEESAFVGGLNWTHVEPDGKATISLMGTVSLPFSCFYGGSGWTPAEYAFGLNVKMSSVSRDGALENEIERFFYNICKVNADGGSTCPPPPIGADDGRATSTFNVIAQ